ncbi:Glycoside hydrolase 131 catalytic N-terminal domain-containing protein [Pleurotus pulmonarius]
MLALLLLTVVASAALATPVVYDGRVPFSFPEANLDTSTGPFLTVVKGTESATHYSSVLGHTKRPTPLWNKSPIPFLPLPIFTVPTEQVIAVKIDNTSVFYPGGNNPQFGFRRTELLAQAEEGGPAALLPDTEEGVTAFHFSIQLDERFPLNYDHEYQIVFIEPSDGSHVFGLQLGSPFTNPSGPLPVPNAHSFKVLDHSLNVLFSAPSSPRSWHNFAVLVDWDNLTLKVYYSKDGAPLKAVTGVVPNLSVSPGDAGKGEFHFGVLKLPLVDASDSPSDQGDVVHHGVQEGSTEGLFYSGVFVEKVAKGISTGYGKTIRP